MRLCVVFPLALLLVLYSSQVGAKRSAGERLVDLLERTVLKKREAKTAKGKSPTVEFPTLRPPTQKKSPYLNSPNSKKTKMSLSKQAAGGCNRLITSTTELLRSNPPGENYANNMDCTYSIQAPANQMIQLIFRHFDVEPFHNPTCSWDSLTVSNSTFQWGPFCGNSLRDINAPGNAQILSGNQLDVRFTSDGSVTYTGFEIEIVFLEPGETPQWDVLLPACTGAQLDLQTGEQTVISYPNGAGNYTNNAACQWNITVPSGFVELVINDIDLEYCSDRCYCDALAVFPSRDATEHIRTFCGRGMYGIVTSPSNEMRLEFLSDYSVTGLGFNVTVRQVDQLPILGPTVGLASCNATFSDALDGVIHSPGFQYGAFYPDGADCWWEIQPVRQQPVVLTFEEFALESCGGQTCPCDRLEVYDLQSADPLRVLCGNNTPAKIVSQSGFRLVFHTDSSVRLAGFLARWSSGLPQTGPAVCGAEQSVGTGGVLQSPIASDGHYSNDLWCSWDIVNVDENAQSILLTFPSFDVESCWDCDCDALEIYSGSDRQALFCGGSAPRPIVLPGPSASLRFRTDSIGTRPGFQVVWQALDQSCGGDLSNPGAVSTLGYTHGMTYRNNANCDWILTVPESDPSPYIRLDIATLDIESCGDRCTCDRLAVYTTADALIAEHSLCGQTSPGPIISRGRSMRIRFTSDGSVTGSGFSATWTPTDEAPGPLDSQPCVDEFIGDAGLLVSPVQSDAILEYANDQECVWLVTVSPGKFASLTFMEFDLERCSRECYCDKVEIFEGVLDQYPLVTLCGDMVQLPADRTIVSHTNVLKVRFVTDYSVTRAGFVADWGAVDVAPPPGPPLRHSCSEIREAGEGVVTSPNYGNADEEYPSHLDCEYRIFAESEDKTIRIRFSDLFDLESCGDETDPCTCDYVEVLPFRPDSPPPPNVRKYCGTERPPNDVVDWTGSVVVKFVTDYGDGGAGFEFTYELLD